MKGREGGWDGGMEGARGRGKGERKDDELLPEPQFIAERKPIKSLQKIARSCIVFLPSTP